MRFGNTVIEPYHHEQDADWVHPANMPKHSLERYDYEAGLKAGERIKPILKLAEESGFPDREFDALQETLEQGYLSVTDIHPGQHRDRYDTWCLGLEDAYEAKEDGK